MNRLHFHMVQVDELKSEEEKKTGGHSISRLRLNGFLASSTRTTSITGGGDRIAGL